MKKDTIAAISTGMTNSGIGIVRISGEEAFALLTEFIREKNSYLRQRAIRYTMDLSKIGKRR